ncbi:hypothetical protein KKD80_03795 [Patescibacteria group bacterium]|nr:hypothetical protein [Patescibacteria group bacterium]
MFSFWHKFIRVILIFIPIITFGWLAAKAIAPNGRMEATYDMARESPFVSKLYPKDRVSEIKQDADQEVYRVLKDEPVYFDLSPNSNFSEVAVTIRYKNSRDVPFKFGGLADKDSWVFDFRELPPTAGALQTKTEIFELGKLSPEGKKFRFGFSAPGFLAGDIQIYKIRALFIRKPMTEKEVANRVLEEIIERLNIIL